MSFPNLTLANWVETRDTIQLYARAVSAVQQKLSPKQKHWWHISLKSTAVGLATQPLWTGEKTIELRFNYFTHELRLRTSAGEEDFISLDGQSIKDFTDELVEILGDVGVSIKLNKKIFRDETLRTYNDTAVEAFWNAFSKIDHMFKAFRATLREETGPVVLWPHHFDLAMLWFSGRLVPDQDPNDPEYADEQMNFGFATGDEYVKNPYFYITAYPMPEGLLDTPLPEGAYWLTDGLTAAILPYATLTTADDPFALVANFLSTVQTAGSAKMK